MPFWISKLLVVLFTLLLNYLQRELCGMPDKGVVRMSVWFLVPMMLSGILTYVFSGPSGAGCISAILPFFDVASTAFVCFGTSLIYWLFLLRAQDAKGHKEGKRP